jgi:hypothetical protein
LSSNPRTMPPLSKWMLLGIAVELSARASDT